MNEQIIRRLLAIGTVAVVVIGCAGTAGTAPSAATSAVPSVAGNKAGGPGQNRVTWTIATGEGEAEEAKAFAAAVAEVSGGAIDVKVDNTTIHGTPMYETEVIKHVADGKAQLGFAAARAFDTVGVNGFVGLHAPFLIDSYELEQRVLTTDWAKALLDGTRPAGVVGIGYFQGPMRRPLGLTRDLVAPSDYVGAKIGIRSSALTEMTLKALGATPVVFTPADSSGLDGMEAHMGLIAGAKYDLGAKSLTGNVMYWPRPGVIFANAAAFDGLTAEQQAILRTAGDRMYAGSVESVSHNGPLALDTLCTRGLALVQAPDAALTGLRAAVQSVYDEIEKDAGTQATIEAIEALRAVDNGSPESAVCRVAAATPKPSSAPFVVATPLLGTYKTSFTQEELAASPLLYDSGEVNTENWGDMTISFDETGRVAFTQSNIGAASSTSGTYSVDGDAVTLAFDEGGNIGETFHARWSLFRDTLTFERIGDLELPTPYLVKSWTRVP